MLELRNLQKSFFQSENRIPVLSGVNLKMAAGDSLAIVGASGTGKSTLLHCMGLLEDFDGGELEISGQVVKSVRAAQALRLRQEMIGFVFQFHYLMSELTALENVMLPLLIESCSPAEAESRAVAYLDKVGLSKRLRHRPAQLSGGEQQRVAIARALVREPKLIIADEPTGNLDPTTAKEVFELLCERSRELQSVFVMATHNLELAKCLQRSLSLVEGRLV